MQEDRQEQVGPTNQTTQTRDKAEAALSDTSQLTNSQLHTCLITILNKFADEILAVVDQLEDDGRPAWNAVDRELEVQTILEMNIGKLDREELEEKPLIWLVKMQRVSGKGKGMAKEAYYEDYYWTVLVSLPERYQFNGRTFTHQAQRLFFIDVNRAHLKISTSQLHNSAWFALYRGLTMVLTGGRHDLALTPSTKDLKQLFLYPNRESGSDFLPVRSSEDIIERLIAFTHRLRPAVIENQKNVVKISATHSTTPVILKKIKSSQTESICDSSITPLDGEGQFPFYHAAANGRIEIVRSFCEKGLLDSKKNAQGYNALLIAALNGHTAVVDYLLDQSPSLITTTDHRENNLLHLSLKNDHVAIAENVLARSQKSAHRQVVKAFIQKNGRLYGPHESPLKIAAKQGHFPLVIKLVKFLFGPHPTPLAHKPIPLSFSERRGYIISALKNGIRRGLCPIDIDLSGIALRDSTFTEMTPLFIKRGIQRLTLRHNLLTHKSGDKLVRLLGPNSALLELDISEMPMGSSGWFYASCVQSIAKALVYNKTLTHLNLNQTQMNNADLAALSLALETNRTLRHLDLRGNPLLTSEAKQDFIKKLIGLSLGIDLQMDGLSQEQARLAATREDQPQLPPSSQALIQTLQSLGQHVASGILSSKEERDNVRKRLEIKFSEQTLQEDEKRRLLEILLAEQEEQLAASPISYECLSSLSSLQGFVEKVVGQLSETENPQLKRIGELAEAHSQQISASQRYLQKYEIQQRLQENKSHWIEHFEIELQHKLSSYWLAANMVETKVLKAAKDQIKTSLQRSKLIFALIALLPNAIRHFPFYGKGFHMLEGGYELLHELVEMTHLVEFISELPGIHPLLHVSAEGLLKIRGLTEEHMLENVCHSFSNYGECNEQCRKLAKAISHRYQAQLFRLDSAEDVKKLGGATAEMLLDYFKFGFYRSTQEIKASLRHEHAVSWLLFGNAYLYRNAPESKAACSLHLEGEAVKVWQFYSWPGLAFRALVDGQLQIVEVDLTLCDKGQLLLRTHGRKFGYCLGMSHEAIELNRQLERSRSPNEEQPLVGTSNSRNMFEFCHDSLRQYRPVERVEVIPFTFLTKTERLEKLEEELEKHQKVIESQATKFDAYKEEQELERVQDKARLKMLENAFKEQNAKLVQLEKALNARLGRNLEAGQAAANSALTAPTPNASTLLTGVSDSSQSQGTIRSNATLMAQHGFHSQQPSTSGSNSQPPDLVPDDDSDDDFSPST